MMATSLTGALRELVWSRWRPIRTLTASATTLTASESSTPVACATDQAPFTSCGCADIPEGDADATAKAHQLDASRRCGGPCEADTDLR